MRRRLARLREQGMASWPDDAPIRAGISIPFATGLLAGGLAHPADVRLVVTVAAGVAALVAMTLAASRPVRRAVLAATAAGLASGSCAAALAHLPLAGDHLARFVGPGNAAVEGTVVSSERAGERLTLVLHGEQLRNRRHRGAASGLLGVTVAHARRDWPAGTRLRLVGRLRRPRNFGNPGGYDLAGALARRGIMVTAFLWDDERLEPLASDVPDPTSRLDAFRTLVDARIGRLTREPVHGYLTAVLLGATHSMDRETRAALTRTGLAHVISVSGFHVAVAAGACFFLVHGLALRSSRLTLRLDVAKLAGALGLIPVSLYAALAGGSVPAARAFLMYGVLLGALACDRPPDGLRALAVAAILLALPVPDIAADIAFQLSFVSVAALILMTRGSREGDDARPSGDAAARVAAGLPAVGAGGRVAWWRRIVVQSLQVSIAATVATAPLTAWHFQQVSLIAPIANLIALPLLGPGTLLPGLAALPLVSVAPRVADALLVTAGMAADAGLGLSVRLATVPWAAVETPMPSLFEVALCYAAIALWWVRPARREVGSSTVSGRRHPWRHAAIVVVAGLWLGDAGYWLWQRYGDATLRVTFLSVGQGDAAVVELPHGGVLVIDGGGFAGDFDPGERLIAPFLRSRKILRLEVIALSHPQLDHYGGLAYLAEHFQPREFWSNGMAARGASFERLRRALADAGARPVVLARGMQWAVSDGVRLEALHPQRIDGSEVNDTSLVLRLVYGRTSVLFTGDIERNAERELLRADVELASTVLKVPHHGSATSSTAPWLAAVAPTIAIISSGADNRFGFPAPDVLARLRSVGATTWNTAEAGAIRVVSDGRRVDVTPTYHASRRERFEFPRSPW